MKFTLILMAGLAIMTCSKRSTEPVYVGTSTFPLTTDSRWVYARTYYEIPFDDSSSSYSEHYSIIRHVIGPDTVIDSLQLYVVDDSTARTDSIIADPFIGRHWYSNSGGQLREYAQIAFYPWETPSPSFFDQPFILLDFPLMPNKSWIAYQFELGTVYSTDVGIEHVTVGDMDIKCDVVRSRLIDPDTGHQYYDSYWWYSNDGLIKNTLDWGIIYMRDETGNIIDSLRNYEEMNLIEMDIQALD